MSRIRRSRSDVSEWAAAVPRAAPYGSVAEACGGRRLAERSAVPTRWTTDSFSSESG